MPKWCIFAETANSKCLDPLVSLSGSIIGQSHWCPVGWGCRLSNLIAALCVGLIAAATFQVRLERSQNCRAYLTDLLNRFICGSSANSAGRFHAPYGWESQKTSQYNIRVTIRGYCHIVICLVFKCIAVSSTCQILQESHLCHADPHRQWAISTI